MIHKEYSWQFQKHQIHAQTWAPEKSIRGVISIVHGVGEHSGRYERWARLFVEKDFALISMDLIGHGKTTGKRGHVKSYEQLLEQIDLLLSKSEELFPDVPRILYGHSMGGNLVINYAISKDPDVNALVATSPWLKLPDEPPCLLRMLASFMDKLYPSLILGSKLKNEYRSRDPETLVMAKNDPLNHGKISVRLFNTAYNRGLSALKQVYKINRPLLIMHGTADRITSSEASKSFASNTSSRTRLKLWEGFYHELHQEPEYLEVFAYVLDWIDQTGVCPKK